MVRMKKRSDGRYGKSFIVNGKRYYVYGATQKDLKAAEEAKREEIRVKSYTKNADITLNEYFEHYQQAREGIVKPVTLYQTESVYGRIKDFEVSPGLTLGALKVSEIETGHIQALQRDQRAKVSTATANIRITLLKSILKAAAQEHVILWNPCEPVRTLRRTETPAKETYHRALTKDETRAFLEAAAACNSWYYRLYVVLLSTGVRVGEATALTAADVRNGVLNVNKTITRDEIGAEIVGDTTKSKAGVRSIPLTEEAKKAISEQMEINASVFDGGIKSLSGRIFRGFRGAIPDNVVICRDMEKICKAANIEKFSCHAFRHTFATRAIESGMSVKTLQTILGHSDVSMTLGLYTHVTEETKEKELVKIKFS